jgi:enamine deaminase RidA (YjgF/YER057c/UK114 family)
MIDKFNPPAVHEPAGYSHVTISRAGRLAHLAGQCPLDLSCEVVGKPGDFGAQTEQVIVNCLAVRWLPGQAWTERALAMVHVCATGAAPGS